MKILKRTLILTILFIIYIYILSIDAIPNKVVLFEGESINVSTMFGVNIQKENKENNLTSQLQLSKENYEVSFFNKLKIKSIEANIIPKMEVIPLGNIIGLKLHTDGVLVVGMSEIMGENDETVKPYKDTNIKEGDRIIEVNGRPIDNTEDLINSINMSEGSNISIKYLRENKEYIENITPLKTSKSEYKLGLWVRDSAAGIGTISFLNPQNMSFVSLGHGIQDIDTKELITISNGTITNANILSITKGEKGNPRRNKGKYLWKK